MEKVTICHSCGRTIDSTFNFCPWCGSVAETEDFLPDQIETIFEQVETMRRRHDNSRITRMENELSELEKELSVLLAGANSI